jgi:hypothetical protein
MKKYELGSAIAAYSLLKGIIFALIKGGVLGKEQVIEIIKDQLIFDVRNEFGEFCKDEEIFRSAGQLLKKLEESLDSLEISPYKCIRD